MRIDAIRSIPGHKVSISMNFAVFETDLERELPGRQETLPYGGTVVIA